MTQQEINLLNFENDLLHTRRRLNDLIYTCSQNPQNQSLYQDKIQHLEKELDYINQQFRMLKSAHMPANSMSPQATMTPDPLLLQQVRIPNPVPPQHSSAPNPMPQNSTGPINLTANRKFTQFLSEKKDLEKTFGRSFMGIFASVLVFISLILFAMLVLPYLTDFIKICGMYFISFSLLVSGLFLLKKNPQNKFYLAISGCGIGAIYISLLLCNLYFKVFGDILLYVFILIWALLAACLSRLKNFVFQVIGQIGIFISMILGVCLCITEGDEIKFLVLAVFYFISASVFYFANRTHPFLFSKGTQKEVYEHNLCSHLFQSFNFIVLTLGFAFMENGSLQTITILLTVLYILLEFFFSFTESCENGAVFQILTVVNAVVVLFLCNLWDLPGDETFFLLMYVIAVLTLLYTHYKKADYTAISQAACLILLFTGACSHSFLHDHLYAYITVLPFMFYGCWKKNHLYLYTSLFFLSGLIFYDGPCGEYLLMTAAAYLLFLFAARKSEQTCFKIIGYPLITLTAILSLHSVSLELLRWAAASYGIDQIEARAILLVFFITAVIHIVLTVLDYFGSEPAVHILLLVVNGMLMAVGCIGMQAEIWQIPVILMTLLLFGINSRKILLKNETLGYYIAFKYMVYLLSVLASFHAVNYVVSICLLLFSIASIIFGFYTDRKTFRLYGLALSMISIVKLLLIDIQYDSSIENAVSFFICGMLCFVISFLYNKIDHTFKNKQH